MCWIGLTETHLLSVTEVPPLSEAAGVSGSFLPNRKQYTAHRLRFCFPCCYSGKVSSLSSEFLFDYNYWRNTTPPITHCFLLNPFDWLDEGLTCLHSAWTVIGFIVNKLFKRDAKIQRMTAGFAFCSTSRKHKQAYGCNTLQLNLFEQTPTKEKEQVGCGLY